MDLSVCIVLLVLAFVEVRRVLIKKRRAREAKQGILNDVRVSELFVLGVLEALAWLTLVILVTQ